MKLLRLFLLALALLPSIASAHTLQVDGDVGVLLHVEPDDAPAAGKDATIVAHLEDRQGRLGGDCSGCGIELTISHDGLTLLHRPLTLADGIAEAPFQFPEGGTYQVSISGKAPAFDVVFAVPVLGAQAADHNPVRDALPYVTMAAVILLAAFFRPSSPSA